MHAAAQRRAIVTGAAGGLGRAIVRRLLADGWHVGACDAPGSEPGRGQPDDAPLATATFDVRDREAVGAGLAPLIEALGGCDALVANAGVVDTIHRAERFSAEAWRGDLDANLTGQFNVAQAAFASLAASGDGRLLFVGSAAAELGLPGQVAYGAAKAGVVGLTRTLAAEWASRGIRVNVIMPGMIATPKTVALPEAMRDQLAGSIPLGRFGEPDEVAGTVAFLLSRDAAYLTGVLLRIDGGLGLNTRGLHR